MLAKIAGSLPAETVGFFSGEKVLSTPSFGREVKQICGMSKNPITYRGSRKLWAKLPDISRPLPFLANSGL
jgi:hypothetical protein